MYIGKAGRTTERIRSRLTRLFDNLIGLFCRRIQITFKFEENLIFKNQIRI